MRLQRLPAIAAFVLFVLFPASTTRAQTNRQIPPNSTISGTLADPSSAAVSGAEIIATPLDATAKPARTVTASNGSFSLAVLPGRYRVTIQHKSFAPFEEDIALAPNEKRKLDIHLELQSFASSVIVTASAEPQLASETPAPVDVITRQQIDQRQEIWLTSVLASVPGASFSQLGPVGGVTSFFSMAGTRITPRC